jgi:subtilisin family serine protease
MATPHVAGVAALIWSHFPTKSNADIRYALGATAKDKGAPGRDVLYGHGIVQAKAALDYLATGVLPTPAPARPPTPAPALPCVGNGASCSATRPCCSGLSCHPKRKVCRVV